MQSNLCFMRKLLLLLFLLGNLLELHGHATFYQAPKSKQLYPRDQSDSATVVISGMVDHIGYNGIIYTFSRNGVILDSINEPLIYAGNTAPFTRNFRIKAERAEYAVHVFIYDNVETKCVLDVDSIVSGDVFLINGQSNGSSPNQGPGLEPQNEWIRTFGSATFNAVEVGQDTLWGLGQGTTTQADFAVGVWGMRLGRLLTDSLQIPVCIINGSRYGTTISAHLPNAGNRTDLNTIYGRLLFRAQKAGVASAAKAMFWYQGESNADTSYQSYSAMFQQLYNHWKSDFGGLSRIFAIQTRPGCILGAAYAFHQQIREVTRQLPALYPDVTLMSTVGIPNFDGCHFLASGYNQLGTQLYYLVQRDVYGQNHPVSIDPSMPLSATFVDPSNSLLAIKMSHVVIWPSDFNGHQLKDYFYTTVPGVQVVNGWTSADTVYLQLSAAAFVNDITYLPGVYYNGTTTIYQGPWLLNSRGVGAMSFANFLVTSPIEILPPASQNFCQGDSVLLSVDKFGVALQWYLDGQPLAGKTGDQLWATAPGNYQVQMTDGFGNSRISAAINIQQYVVTPVQILEPDTSICSGEVLQLNAANGVSFQWSDNSTGASLSVNQSGVYAVTALDVNGCSSIDSVSVIVNPLPLAEIVYANGLTACQGDTIFLSLANNETGLWSNGLTASGIQVNFTGYYSAVVTNAFGCTKLSDTVYVSMISTPVSIVPSGPLSVCSNQKISFQTSGSGFASYQWNMNGIPVDGATLPTYRPIITGQYSVTITDSFGCKTTSAQTLVTLRNAPQSVVTVSNQFDNCNDSIVTLTANSGNSLSYQWTRNGNVIPGATARTLLTQQAGTYRVTVTNSWGCSRTSSSNTFPISMPKPTISVTGSSVFCSGDSVMLVANSPSAVSFQWIRNNNSMAGAANDTLFAKKTGYYKVIATNLQGCTATSAGRYVSASNCVGFNLQVTENSRLEHDQSSQMVVHAWPNPFSAMLTTDLQGNSEDVYYRVLDVTGRVVSDGMIPAGLNQFFFHGENWAAGTYLLHLADGRQQQTIRLHKED